MEQLAPPPERTGPLDISELLANPDRIRLSAPYDEPERIPARDIEKYNDAMETYYAEYEQYLIKLVRRDELWSRTIQLNIELENSGTATAEDIGVFIKLPSDLEVTASSKRFKKPGEPKLPEKPKPPKTPMELLLESRTPPVIAPLRASDFNPSGYQEPPRVTWEGLKREDDFHIASFDVKKLKHGYADDCPRALYVIFDSLDSMCSFRIEYRIMAGNLPKHVEGSLHVIRAETKG